MVCLPVSVRSFRDRTGGNPCVPALQGFGARFARAATGFDQESIATLILSGRYLGFLPDHYAEAFERRGRMQAVRPELLRYECRFVGLVRRSPAPSRAAQAFGECLVRAHA